jgi:formylglycine-generating enzyme required for sulfatase activity
LPTEAEWEYAARGPEGNVYPWGDAFDPTKLNYCELSCYNMWRDTSYEDGYDGLAPVGSFETGASWCGALDMAGNAAEWVADWYAEDYYANSPALNPQGPDSGTERVFRGGASNHVASYVRSAWRASQPPTYDIYGNVGFRCAQSISAND